MAHHSAWGPSGLIVEQIVRRAAKLTDEEGSRLFEAWCEQPEIVDKMWGAAVHAAAASGRDAGHISLKVMDSAPTAEGASAVRDAAYAAILSDLVGQYGLTAEHIDALMGPWMKVIGDPRIDPVCECEPIPGGPPPFRGTGDDRGTGPVYLALGALAPQPGDRYPWLVMLLDPAEPEPLIVGYATTETEALRLAEKVDGPVLMWRAGKEAR